MGEVRPGPLGRASAALTLSRSSGAAHRGVQNRWAGRRPPVRRHVPASRTAQDLADHIILFGSRDRLVFDRETGKPRGYGFCEFAGTSSSPVCACAREYEFYLTDPLLLPSIYVA